MIESSQEPYPGIRKITLNCTSDQLDIIELRLKAIIKDIKTDTLRILDRNQLDWLVNIKQINEEDGEDLYLFEVGAEEDKVSLIL